MKTAEITESPTAEVFERLNRARQLMDQSYDLPLDLKQISSEACFSRYHFLRLFRQAFNKTPHQYLVERRIEKAKELLTSADLRVTDVCFQVDSVVRKDTPKTPRAPEEAKLRE
jgi:AraC-like DNA-binding protein